MTQRNQNTRADLEGYIHDTLNVDLRIQPLAEKKLGQLPFALTSLYAFGSTRFFNHELILIFVDPGETSVDRIQKHLQIVRTVWNTLVVAVFDHLESYTRRRLIEKKIPFIIPGKQMYMPDLLIDLKEFALARKEATNIMPPAAQCLLLFVLQAHPLVNRNLKGIAELIQFNPMKMTRAADYLQAVGLCEIEGSKDKYLRFDPDKKALWNKALPMMSSPVKRYHYYDGQIKNERLRRSNINALAHYTDLNDERVKYYAASAGFVKQFEGPAFRNIGRMEGDVCIEEWKYDPAILAKNTKFIDPLSLYLCFKEDKNERVEGALEQLIKNMLW
jgi:hypothetical protein